MTEEALSDLLRRLAVKSKITASGRIRWHCLRKFGVTVMHGEITQPVMLYMTGKHISKDLRTYIQNNRETFKAFKKIEPLISISKTNGNGNIQLVKELEQMKEQISKSLVLEKLIEKLVPRSQIIQALHDIAKEYGITLAEIGRPEGKGIVSDTEFHASIDQTITFLAKKIQEKDLERTLAEYNNNNH
jgi:hypothetical protein